MSPATRSKRLDRMDLRLRPEQKRQIEHAAGLRGLAVSAFVLKHASDAAQRIIQENRIWSLSCQDREEFVESLLHPRPPSVRLKGAAKRYKQRAGTK